MARGDNTPNNSVRGESEYYQLVTLDRPCRHCVGLELDDAKHGATIKQNKNGERFVDFGVVQETCLDRDGDNFAMRGRMAGLGKDVNELETFPKMELKLAYEREDTLPGLPDVASTASQGCSFCRMLEKDITAAWNKVRQSTNDNLENGKERIHEAKLAITGAIYRCNETSQDDEGDKRIFLDSLYVLFTVDWGSGQKDCSLHYNIHADATDPCALWFQIWRRPIPNDYLSPPSIKRLNKLIDKSLVETPAPVRDTLYYPTRLIDVGSSNGSKLRLIISADQPALVKGQRYAALSYCWGSEDQAEKQLKTTNKTIDEHTRQIKFEQLPQTVADTVQVCRAIGIRFLWVDALCIKQGDIEDWARESFEMSNVYANSFVTLCILHGDACSSGFLKRPHKPDMMQMNFRSSLDNSVSGKLYLRMVNTPEENLRDSTFSMTRIVDTHSDVPAQLDLDKASWSKRGWTFQESWLSPRKLFLGSLMFHISCGRLHESADGSNFKDDDFFPKPDAQISDVLSHWYSLVEVYGQRALSYESDRLPALSAFARTISERFPGQEYLAGLWKSDLHKGLLWTPYSWTDIQSYLKRPKDGSIPPTWSWAHRPKSLNWVTGVTLDHFPITPEFKLMNAHINCEPLNPFGRVFGGTLELDAKMYQFPLHKGEGKIIKPPVAEWRYIGINFQYALVSTQEEYIASLHLDWLTLGDKKNPDDLVVLDQLRMVLISRSSLNNKHLSWEPARERGLEDPEIMLGLLLLPTGKEDEFFKVGLWYSETRGLGGSKFWDYIARRPVKLV